MIWSPEALRDPNIDEDLKLRHGLKEYRDAVVDSAMLQGDLMSGTGQTMLKVLKEIYEKRLDELAQADSQIRAIVGSSGRIRPRYNWGPPPYIIELCGITWGRT